MEAFMYYLEEIDTLNVEYLNQVLKDVFNEKNMIISVVKNQKKIM